MGFSVNTNLGAMAALQSLNETNRGLAQVQSRINTGLSVSSTKDDSASYAIAQTLRGDLGGLKAVSSSLIRAHGDNYRPRIQCSFCSGGQSAA